MAAYAALVSLSHILRQILHPPPLYKIIVDKEQIEFLQGNVSFLIDFLENYSSRCGQEIADLEMLITDAAYEAEDIIESNVLDQILTPSLVDISRFTLLCEGIQMVLVKFLSIKKELIKMRGIQGVRDLQPKRLATATSSRSFPSRNNAMVGFEDHMKQIMDALATNESNREIIPIVGMGGIGKTTLATAVYNHPSIIEYFHVRAWVTVSQGHTVRELLLRLLSEITKADQNKQESTDDEIGELLYKELFDRKYLIVMDDMWDIQAWDNVKRFLPPNSNESRILVTTRLSNLADHFGSCTPYKMDLLDEGQSWDLLREKIFMEEDCPVELEELGKYIAKRCSGLPLAPVVIGGLLARSERTREHWESVVGDMTCAFNYGIEEHLMNVLSLSYIHLPIYLKPCFLYLAMFPEDFEIRVFTLVRLWVAEGLINPNQAICLEEVAHEYLEDLISRNLILVDRRGSRGKVKYCKIHDLIRELCIKQAEKEKFVHIARLDSPSISTNIETKRRLSITSSERVEVTAFQALRSAKSNRSLSQNLVHVYGMYKHWKVDQIIHGFRLLKVVHVSDPEIPIDILRLHNLRCVVAESVSSVMFMFLSWNLQTLVVRDNQYITLPAEIWQMPQLRHLKMKAITLHDPPDDQNLIVLEDLQTLETIENFKCTEKVSNRIPNLKKLRISYDFRSSTASELFENYCLMNLVCFKKLESLGIEGAGKLRNDIAFPISLKKLCLRNCKIPWEDLSIVGKLPNLEVLKLYENATEGEEWSFVD